MQGSRTELQRADVTVDSILKVLRRATSGTRALVMLMLVSTLPYARGFGFGFCFGMFL